MTNSESGTWHREVLSATTEAALHSLRDAALVDPFYLAGGTGLALQLGHRLSQDLDFFANDLFNEEPLLQRLQVLSDFSLVEKAPHTLHAVVQQTKVSFLGYRYPLLFTLLHFHGAAVADPRDIACMKLSAIASRGTKRDFVDLYIATRQLDLGKLLELFERKYAATRYNRLHVLKSLTFFADAEKDPMPHMLMPLDWNEVRGFFLQETPKHY